MAGKSSKSNQKRPLKSKQKPVAKRQKEICEKSINNEAAIAPITDICNELLDRIMDFLDIASLLNVADTCKRLRVAAAAKFGSKIGNREVRLHQDSLDKMPDRITILEHCCYFGSKHCLPLLRCFGDKISNLCVENDEKETADKSDERLYRYIDQYCADTLTTLQFNCGVLTDSFSKPMENVTKLVIFYCNIGKQLPNFVKWFPNLRALTLYIGSKIDEDLTAVPFPHLETLSFDLNRSSGHFNSKCATTLLRANPLLKNVHISLCYEKSFGQLLNMLSKHRFLLKLEVWGKVKGVNAAALNRISIKHPLLEALELGGDDISVEDAVHLIHPLYWLKKISFQFYGLLKCDHLLTKLDSHWLHSIAKDPYVELYQIVLCH